MINLKFIIYKHINELHSELDRQKKEKKMKKKTKIK